MENKIEKFEFLSSIKDKNKEISILSFTEDKN